MRYIALIAVILFCSGYWICDLFFENGTVQWWDLRFAIFTVIFALCFYIGWALSHGFTKAVFLVGMVFCAGDIMDRYIFDIQKFNINDLLLYFFAIYYLIKTYAREIRS